MADDGLGTPVDNLPDDETQGRPPDTEEGFVPERNDEPEGQPLAWLQGADEETIKYASGKKWANATDAAKSAREAETRMRKLEGEAAEERRQREALEQYLANLDRGGNGNGQAAPPAGQQEPNLDALLENAYSAIDAQYDSGKIDGAEAGRMRAQVLSEYTRRSREQMMGEVAQMIGARVSPVSQRLIREDVDRAVGELHDTNPEYSAEALEVLESLEKMGMPAEVAQFLHGTPFGAQFAYGQVALRHMKAEAEEKRRAPETLNAGSRGRVQGVDVGEIIKKRIMGAAPSANDGL